jgi:hypothetical protein
MKHYPPANDSNSNDNAFQGLTLRELQCNSAIPV